MKRREFCQVRFEAGLPCRNCVRAELCGKDEKSKKKKSNIKKGRWSAEEIAVASDVSISVVEVAKRIQRPIQSVYQWRSTHGFTKRRREA